VERTNDHGDALVPWYRFFVVALAPLERLGEVDRGLVRFSLEIQLVDATLRDH
jgi:hypothetical protein